MKRTYQVSHRTPSGTLMPPSSSPCFLEPNTIREFHIRKLAPAFLKEFDGLEIESVDFSESGNYSLCSSYKLIKIYKLDECEPKEFVINYNGIGIAKFHKKLKIIHSTKENGVSYYDLHNKSYVIKFGLGSQEITGISIINENYFSTSSKNGVKIWDIRRHDNGLPFQCLRNESNPLVACNPLKKEIAVAYKLNRREYKIEKYYIYDLKILQQLTIKNDENCDWTELKYSNDGLMLLASTKNSVVVVIDAKSGKVLHELKGFENLYNLPIEACFTPCSQFVASGSQNSVVHFWDLQNSEKLCTLKYPLLGPIHKVAFNPKTMCLATAGEGKFCIWVENET